MLYPQTGPESRAGLRGRGLGQFRAVEFEMSVDAAVGRSSCEIGVIQRA